MTELAPASHNGKIVPGVFVDAGTKEPYFFEELWNGERVYSHESGYGFLKKDEVIIKLAS